MSGFSEEIDCPKCDGIFHVSTDSDPMGNYGFCLDCGYSYSMTESQLLLKEVNEERVEWGLLELEDLRKQKED